jgi:hypothetical protein
MPVQEFAWNQGGGDGLGWADAFGDGPGECPGLGLQVGSMGP